MFAADAQSISRKHLRDFRYRSSRFKTKIADDDVRFVNQNARAFFETAQADPRIDVAVIIRAADHDMRRVARRAAEKRADAIGGRSDFLDHLFQLLDHLARITNDLLLLRDRRTQRAQIRA